MTTFTQEYVVAANAPRVYWDGSDWVFETGQDVVVGYLSAALLYKGGGCFCFNVTIPKEAVIADAKITVVAGAAEAQDDVNSVLEGSDADNPSVPTDYTEYATIPRTASVNWNGVEHFGSGGSYDSPDIASIIQTIVNRAGWSSGNTLIIFWHDHANSSTQTDGTSRRVDHAYVVDAWKMKVTLTVNYSGGLKPMVQAQQGVLTVLM